MPLLCVLMSLTRLAANGRRWSRDSISSRRSDRRRCCERSGDVRHRLKARARRSPKYPDAAGDRREFLLDISFFSWQWSNINGWGPAPCRRRIEAFTARRMRQQRSSKISQSSSKTPHVLAGISEKPTNSRDSQQQLRLASSGCPYRDELGRRRTHGGGFSRGGFSR